MVWVSGTNPLVSLPNLQVIRDIFTQPGLFVVCQDMTQTAAIADVVLPEAQWEEKTGCFTNVDRTVHISHKAIKPPGEEKPGLQICLDYARMMGFKDKDGQDLFLGRCQRRCLMPGSVSQQAGHATTLVCLMIY